MGDFTRGYVAGYAVGGGVALLLKWLGNSNEVVLLAIVLGAFVTMWLDYVSET